MADKEYEKIDKLNIQECFEELRRINDQEFNGELWHKFNYLLSKIKDNFTELAFSNAEFKLQIEKMKCCSNCKFLSRMNCECENLEKWESAK